MINGILLINKEKDITSYGVIRKLKKVLPKGQRVGHAGTLDPFATGLLIILLGKYTKQMIKILEMEKEYLVKAEFGYATDTQDPTGKKIKEVRDLEQISKRKIQKVLEKKFTGVISQIPPQFSAKKIKGKKAYEYARNGKKVNLRPREIEVKDFKVVNYNWPLVQFRVVCSSGTYIRTLINDLGEELGIYATAIELERVRIGEYTLDEALDSKDIVESMDIGSIKLIKYMEE
jgi:tRNA pseudouridine55 synthase